MLMFTLAISCLITFNLSWFMYLIFQVPMQYCSLQHQTLLLPPDTSTVGGHLCFGWAPSFFLELFLHPFLVASMIPTKLGSPSYSVLSFLLFHTVHGVLNIRLLKWFAIFFSSVTFFVRTLHHIRSSCVALQGMAHHFIELHKVDSYGHFG